MTRNTSSIKLHPDPIASPYTMGDRIYKAFKPVLNRFEFILNTVYNPGLSTWRSNLLKEEQPSKSYGLCQKLSAVLFDHYLRE